ncbi:MAG: tRNA-guanine transglycosylase [Candidatus Methanofastidiosia archaeon]
MENGLAELKVLKTEHGKIRTPALIPVVATSYGIWDLWIDEDYPKPWEKASSVILSLYHILQYKMRREEVFERGIHRVLKTKKPVFLDSGGFQYMKKGVELEPLEVLSYQKRSGCDVGITFDYPILPNLSEKERLRRLEKSIDAANLMLQNNEKMKLYGAIHGSNSLEIKSYMKKLSKGFSGYGIGSLVPRKSHYEHLTNLIYSTRLSTQKPLHCFGITGFPALFALSYLGVDTFDSWTYVVAAAYKEYVHPEKLNRLKDLKNLTKLPECRCKVCEEYGLKEMIQPTSKSEVILALHNLNVFLYEMERVRESIGEGSLSTYIEKRSKGGNRNIKVAFKFAKKMLKTKSFKLKKR